MNKIVVAAMMLGLVVTFISLEADATEAMAESRAVSGGSTRLSDRDRYEQSGGAHNPIRDREWADRFRGNQRFDRCMRGCLREDGLRYERRCRVNVCRYEGSVQKGGYGDVFGMPGYVRGSQ